MWLMLLQALMVIYVGKIKEVALTNQFLGNLFAESINRHQERICTFSRFASSSTNLYHKREFCKEEAGMRS